jgi:putative intracellular protease/amidase
MKILMVLTSHDQLGDTGTKTGFWLEEFAAPYYVFKDAGAEIALTSTAGDQPLVDPRSEESQNQTPATTRFSLDNAARAALAHAAKLSSVVAHDCDAVFYPGGHGPLWDLAEDLQSIRLIETTYASGKPIAAVCHAPGVFRHTRTPSVDPLVKGKSGSLEQGHDVPCRLGVARQALKRGSDLPTFGRPYLDDRQLPATRTIGLDRGAPSAATSLTVTAGLAATTSGFPCRTLSRQVLGMPDTPLSDLSSSHAHEISRRWNFTRQGSPAPPRVRQSSGRWVALTRGLTKLLYIPAAVARQ